MIPASRVPRRQAVRLGGAAGSGGADRRAEHRPDGDGHSGGGGDDTAERFVGVKGTSQFHARHPAAQTAW